MNKAFVRENDAADEDDALPGQPSLPVGTPNYMTLRGQHQLREEFEQLVKVERPALVQVVSWAAGNGDRSENGDYIYGKKRLREIDRRIRYLGKRLENAVVVDPAEQENLTQVFFGATVSFVDLQDVAGTEECYQIVGVDEADASAGRISWLSPLARALMKAREADVIRFQSPAGLRELEVVAIRYE
ncbi:MAG: transcription elongation factor GreB [Sterolibacterium sp.]|nr:transcription elongation factor GreB [Sterolibacterium sp.]